MDKLTQLTNEYNEWARTKQFFKESKIFREILMIEGIDAIKLCDREMDKLKKEISEESKE